MVVLQNVVYTHPDKNLLFEDINLVVNPHDKLAIIGNNGSGKSTLLKIIAGQLHSSAGQVISTSPAYYVPQHYGQYNHLDIAGALRVDEKLNALRQILDGHVTAENMTLLNDDWGIEERCNEALAYWGLDNMTLDTPMSDLSGGQKTKVFLAGIMVHNPEFVLMDEPGNHLDISGRGILYKYIGTFSGAMIVVSHDRKLLNLFNVICELDKNGLAKYGGNYDFYKAQKQVEENAANEELKAKEKALRKAREIQKETIERQQKLDARGKKKQLKSGVPAIMMNTLRNNAEKSTSKIIDVHAEKVGGIAADVKKLRQAIPDRDKMKIVFDDMQMHQGKLLLNATAINFGYGIHFLWELPLSFEIIAGERIAIKGDNGSGKTTLIKIITGLLAPQTGNVWRRGQINPLYIDQEYSVIDNGKTVYEQAQHYNTTGLEEHELRSRLMHFLFDAGSLNKQCDVLSGGEKIRLILCCVTLSKNVPDVIILDEPTNNLDIQNVNILTNAIEDYTGTIIVISHDELFLRDINVTRGIYLESRGEK